MTSTLGTLSLSLSLDRAAILLRGPQDVVTSAFTALGRTPRMLGK